METVTLSREPAAWANWKVGTRSYVPYRTREQAEACVRGSEIAATQLGPYKVVPLYAALADPVAPAGPIPVAWRGLNDLGEVVTEWIDGAPPSSMVDLHGNPASFASIELAYACAAPVPHADDEPLTCDFCGTETDDPWHSSGWHNGVESKHLHKCDKCYGGLTPPAGEEVEVVAEIVNKYGDPEAFAERDLLTRTDIDKIRIGTELVDRAHVTRLQAEVEGLQAMSVTNILMDVVPGDGDGYEVYAKSVDEVVNKLTELSSTSEDLQVEVEQLRSIGGVDALLADLRTGRDVLQSELTKAREFLVHVKKCLIRNKEYAPLSHQELDGFIGHSPSNSCHCLWCGQSAPAAKV
jgi:hypothetical protein